MRCHFQSPSFTGTSATLCIEPGKFFCVRLFVQERNDFLNNLPVQDRYDFNTISGGRVERAGIGSSTAGDYIWHSLPDTAPRTYDQDWNWPEMEIRWSNRLFSVQYVAVVYEVSPVSKAPIDAVGLKLLNRQNLYPYDPDAQNGRQLLHQNSGDDASDTASID